jgi:RimJ/RimL family protein N-acetyltransferase
MKIETARLLLEPFSLQHLDGLHSMDSDPQVMRYIGPVKTIEETRTSINGCAQRWDQLGYGWWAVIEKENGDLIGSACVQNVAHAPDAPLELAWRFTPSAQGKGYATEAGKAAMRFAFEHVNADLVIAVAHPENAASIKVMQRIGMTYRGTETHYGMQLPTYVRHNASST